MIHDCSSPKRIPWARLNYHMPPEHPTRGRGGGGCEVIAVDGGKGLLSVLPDHYPAIPVQRCWAHTMGEEEGSRHGSRGLTEDLQGEESPSRATRGGKMEERMGG